MAGPTVASFTSIAVVQTICRMCLTRHASSGTFCEAFAFCCWWKGRGFCALVDSH